MRNQKAKTEKAEANRTLLTVTPEDWDVAEKDIALNKRRRRKVKDYNCMCVVAQAFKRQFPFSTLRGVYYGSIITEAGTYRMPHTLERVIEAFDDRKEHSNAKLKEPVAAYIQFYPRSYS